jgi:hypothetical protein
MLFISITVILVAILILYMLMIKSEAKTIYYPTIVKTAETKETNGTAETKLEPATEKEKMFQTYFPEVKNGVQLDYPLQTIGCCPPSKEMSKDLPVANIPICYAKNSKTSLNQ